MRKCSCPIAEGWTCQYYKNGNCFSNEYKEEDIER